VDDSRVIPPRVGQQHADFTSDLPFRLLVDSVRDYAIFLLDPEGHVLTWNAGAQSIKGYAKEEILGKHFSVFYLAEAQKSAWPDRELALAIKEGRFQDEGWRVKKDGSTFWASVTLTALRQTNGHLYGFAKVTQDLTSRRQAEQRIHELNKELRTRVAQLDESQRLIELHTLELQKLSSQLLQSQDDERRRIARELHDDLAQQISALKWTWMPAALSNSGTPHATSSYPFVTSPTFFIHRCSKKPVSGRRFTGSWRGSRREAKSKCHLR
jgi:PAS domain S-box-containing protein